MGSNPSLYSPHGSDEDLKNDRAREDLYQWMAKQEPIKVVSNLHLNFGISFAGRERSGVWAVVNVVCGRAFEPLPPIWCDANHSLLKRR